MVINGGKSGNSDFLGRDGGVGMGDDGLALVIPTAINISQKELDFYNSITCFFDRWWYPTSNGDTLPFAFFHITEWRETTPVSLQDHRVIVYQIANSASDDDSLKDPVARSSIASYIDNVEVKPKQYRVSCIVPNVPLDRGFLSRLNEKFISETTPEAAFSMNFQDRLKSSSLNQEYKASERSARSALKTQKEKLKLNEYYLGSNLSSQMINKNSLDAMAESGKIIEMKSWIGDKKIYGVIKDLDLEKKSGEDGVWRATFTFVESKILSVSPQEKMVSVSNNGSAITDAINAYGNLVGYGTEACKSVKFFQ